MITGTSTVETTLKRHGLSAAFFDPPDKELDRMAEDIRDHGLIEPIVTIEENGERFVLDGWGRYRCCLKAGVEPRFVDFVEMKTGLTPTDFAMSRNMFRKHLTPTQRACVSVEVYDGKWLKTGVRREASPDSVVIQEVAKAARVSMDTLRAVKTIHKADPAIFAKLKSGELTGAAQVYRSSPTLRIQKHTQSPGAVAARALSPMLIGVRDLAANLKLKPADFAKQWVLWEGGEKAKRLKDMKQARQWLDEAITAVEAQAASNAA